MLNGPCGLLEKERGIQHYDEYRYFLRLPWCRQDDLIKKLIKESFAGQKVVLIENEFGEIGIDGGFLKESGIQINELNAGCICCSLVGDFRAALQQVVEQYHPDRIVIEPSGVAS